MIRHAALAWLLLGLPSLVAQGTCPHPYSNAVFFHDFERAGSGVAEALVGPAGRLTSNIGTSSAGRFASASRQHIQAPSGYGVIDTGVRLMQPTDALSFSIAVNARGDASNRLKRLLSTFNGTGPAPASEMLFDRVDAGVLRFITAGRSIFSASTIVEDGQWHTYGFTFDRGTVQFYVDGMPFDPPRVFPLQQIAPQTYSWHLVEDARNVSANTEFWRGGSYDDAGLWLRVLSAAEMLQLHQGLCGNCLFRNGSGVNATGFQCLSRPLLGRVWRSQIPVVPATLGTWVGVSGFRDQIPYLGGEVLIGQQPKPLFFPGLGNHAITIPALPGLLGVELYAQGLRADQTGAGLQLTLFNGQDLILTF